MRRVVILAVAVLLGLGALVALAGGGRDGSERSSDGASSAVPSTAGAGSGGAATSTKRAADAAPQTLGSSAAEVAGDGAVTRAVPPAPDDVVRTATVEIGVSRRALDRRASEARTLATSLGGYVERSETSGRLATLVLRVPADRYDDAMTGVRRLGSPRSRSESGQNVGGQIVDLDARIRNLESQEAVLQQLMARAESIGDTIAVEQQLFSVREQIEQLRGQRQLLADQTTFATVTLTLRASAAAPAPDPAGAGRLATAWHEAWDVAAAIVAGTIVVLGALVPLGLLGLLAWLVWVLARRRRPGVGPVSA